MDNVVDFVSPLRAESAECQGQGSVEASTYETDVASFTHLLARSLKGGPCSGMFVSPLKINFFSPEGTVISPLDSNLALSGPYKDDCRAQLHLSPDIKSKSTILPPSLKTSTLHIGSHLIGPSSSLHNHTFIHTDPIPSPNPQPYQLEPNLFLEPILHPIIPDIHPIPNQIINPIPPSLPKQIHTLQSPNPPKHPVSLKVLIPINWLINPRIFM